LLYSHLDRFNTHVISAILNIAQEVEVPWPLYIEDNSGGSHTFVLKPGEMLWYESARLVHGRPQPLQGKMFDNIFLHFRPLGESWYPLAEQPMAPADFAALPIRTAEQVRDSQARLGLVLGRPEDWVMAPSSGTSQEGILRERPAENPRLAFIKAIYAAAT